MLGRGDSSLFPLDRRAGRLLITHAAFCSGWIHLHSPYLDVESPSAPVRIVSLLERWRTQASLTTWGTSPQDAYLM